MRDSHLEDVALRSGCLWHTNSEEGRMKVGMALAKKKECDGRKAWWCLQAEVGSLWAKEGLPVHRGGADYDTRVPGRTEEEADRDKKNKVSG